jgi:hypothetical protein
MNAGLHGTCGMNAEVPEHKNTKIRPTKFHILPITPKMPVRRKAFIVIN